MDSYGEYPTNRLAVDAMTVAPDAVVIDMGCGTAGRLIGVEPVPRMLQSARERAAEERALSEGDVA